MRPTLLMRALFFGALIGVMPTVACGLIGWANNDEPQNAFWEYAAVGAAITLFLFATILLISLIIYIVAEVDEADRSR